MRSGWLGFCLIYYLLLSGVHQCDAGTVARLELVEEFDIGSGYRLPVQPHGQLVA